MQTHIQKWGNSLGMRIPAKLSHELNLRPGSIVDILIEDNHLVITPRRYQLDDLLENISKANLHNNLLDDPLKGKEEW